MGAAPTPNSLSAPEFVVRKRPAGYAASVVQKVIGGNFRRVLGKNWIDA
jgi:hypothetical protein